MVKRDKFPPIILMLSGEARGGKDTVAKMMRELIELGLSDSDGRFMVGRVATMGFADILKSLCSRNHGYKNKKDDREILLRYGDVMRDIDIDVFVKPISHMITVYRELGYNVFIITDTRFKNEYDYLDKYSCGVPYVIRVRSHMAHNGVSEETKNHKSEKFDFDYDYELVLDDLSTTDGLVKTYKKIEEMLLQIGDEFWSSYS